MFLGGGYETGARLLGVSLETYGFFHHTIGFVAFIEALVHIIITAQIKAIEWSNTVEFYGLLTGCMFLALSILPLIRKRVYEIFVLTHTGCALTSIYGIWCHVRSDNGSLSKFPLAYLCIFALTRTIQLSRMIYRNITIGTIPVRLVMSHFEGNIARITLSVPRPWTVRAGERINLGVPRVGIFYSFQAHPFAISWWEENDKGRAVSISFLIRPRSGFTKKLLKRIEPNRECGAWVDGPYGPSSIDWKGGTSAGDYGHIFMVATGIGIAAQLPYIKEVLHGHENAQVCTQRISLVWQIDAIGDWDSVRDWLQALVKQDNGYILHVSIYDPFREEDEMKRIGENELIEAHSGVVDWGEQFEIETQSHIGRLLVAVSAQPQVRRDIRDLVRTRMDGNTTLFEPEFQPWGQTGSLRSYLKP
ncbi:uncharacterized protein N7484_007021 [Penicillium longicatenatum]|uniref:uncharacterized protein n=1 Tax=Penicillium longicatenatum TaxID=1561947 RepID=UPI0025472A9B|nr:uncharacterized protein N7484_007021 [Penicillium longicatenatum]KAJ5639159.1 hypothetical protein N7484_007021 [Penicillium longicatenatum]